MSKGGASGVSGYRYAFDILMGLCRGPIDQLVSIRVGDIEVWPGLPAGTAATSPALEQQRLQALFSPGASYVAPIQGFAGEVIGAPVNATQGFSITAPNAFGGDKGEGGIVGSAAMLMGEIDQVIPGQIKDSISSGTQGHTYVFQAGSDVGNDFDTDSQTTGDYTVQARDDISEFRGVATIFYTGSVCSNNPYPKQWKMRTQRVLKGWDEPTGGCWYPEKALVLMEAGTVGAMNPAHILYQCLTDPAWGRGMGRAELDDAAWRYAADYMAAEGFGLCARWSTESDLNDFIQMIIDHIGGSLYVDRASGLMVLRLIRNDYDAATLPVFTYNSGLLSVEAEETGSSNIVTNEVVVKYQNIAIDMERQIRVQNLASIQSIGCVVSETKDYSACPDAALARRMALRDLQAVSSGLKRLKITCDRRAWRLQPGGVLRIQALDKGIIDVVLRIATYDDGTAVDGTIKMDCVQDVFGLPSTVFTDEPTGGWVGPQSTVPPALPRQLVTEASYYDMVRSLTPSELGAVTPDEGGLIAIAARPTSNTMSTLLAVTPEGGTPALAATGTFAPAASTRAAVGYYDTAIPLQGGTELDKVVPGTLAMLGTEMVRVDAIDLSAGTLTVGRGCGDTIPTPHPKSTLIFFTEGTSHAHTSTYAVGETVGAQLLSRTAHGILDPAAAASASVTITGRWAKPYPPGNVRIDMEPALVDAGSYVVGDVLLEWSARNKAIQADQLVAHPAGPVAAEAGTTYTVEVRDRAHGDALLRTHAGIAASQYLYTESEAGSTPDPVELDFVLFSVLNGLRSEESYHLRVFQLATSGYGSAYGAGSGSGGYGMSYGTAYDLGSGLSGYGSSYGFFYGLEVPS